MSLRGSQKSPPWRGGLAGAEIGVARGPKKPENRPGNGPEIARKSPQIGPKIDPEIDPAGGGKFPRKMPDFPVLAGPRKMANFGGRRANFRNPVPKLSRKSEKLSRMGELLNSLRNVQNLPPPLPPPPRHPPKWGGREAGSGPRNRGPGGPAGTPKWGVPPRPGGGGSNLAPPGSPRADPPFWGSGTAGCDPQSSDPGPEIRDRDQIGPRGGGRSPPPTGVWQVTRRW